MEEFKKIADRMIQDKMRSKDDPLPPIESASDQSPDELKLIAYIRDKVDECRHSGSRIAYEAIWLTNVAYMLGFSGVAYDPVLRQFKNTDTSQKYMRRNRMRVNKILPTIQNRLARLCQSPPQYDVKPNSNSTQDKDAARLALQCIENIFDRENMSEKIQELFMTTQQFGYAFMQVVWDPCKGEPMINPDTQELEDYEGDIRLDILSPFEVFPDPLAKRMEDVSWWVKAKVRKLSYFKERYKERGDAVKEEDAWLLSSQYEQRINALTASGITGASIHQQMKNSAIEIVYYEKRSKNYPKGRKCVAASGILLEDGELPLGEFDLTKFDDILVAGKFQSESVVTHLRPIQDQYNLLITKRAEWMRKTLAAKFVVARGAGLEQEALTDSSGEVYHYNVVPNAPNGGMPMVHNIPNIPSYAYKEEDMLNAQFDFVSGLSEISRGQLPFAGIPAEGMQMLMEADQTRIGVMTSRNEIGFSNIAKHILMYVSQYYKTPRLLKMAGDGLEYTVKDFIGADLKDNYDVCVLPGSTVPSSKSLKRQEIINAYQLGIIGPIGSPQTLKKLAKMLEFGDSFEIWKTQALTDSQIKKTIAKIEDGTFDMRPGKDLQEFDDHLEFFREMNDYRMSDKFSELDDHKQQLFMYVMEWHLQAQTAMMNPGLASQQQLAQHIVAANNASQPPPQGLGGGQPMAPTAAQAPGQQLGGPQMGAPPPPSSQQAMGV